METTLNLLHRALAQNNSQAFWSEQLHMGRNALANAKLRGRLSPTVAGNLARLIGEDATYWTALAALEAEPDSYGRRKLMSTIGTRRNS